MTDFHRVKRLPPYVFEQVNRLKAKARAGGADIIDLGCVPAESWARAGEVTALLRGAAQPSLSQPPQPRR